MKSHINYSTNKQISLPKFSVTIGCYKNDNPKDFETAFYSIYNQTVRPNEIIITVDGPIPSDLDEVVIRVERKNGVVVLRSKKNQGLGIAHAQAVAFAKYDWVAIMDADDISVPDRFEKQLSYISEHPDIDIIGGQIEEFIDSPNNVIGKRIVPETNCEIKRYLRKRCPMNHMTIMFKKESVLSAGNYQDWYFNEDYFLYCRLYTKGAVFHNLPDVLVSVRVGTEMYKRRGGLRYFKSETNMQKWMLSHKIITYPQCCFNIVIRFCVQVIMPNWLRGFVFKKIFRK